MSFQRPGQPARDRPPKPVLGQFHHLQDGERQFYTDSEWEIDTSGNTSITACGNVDAQNPVMDLTLYRDVILTLNGNAHMTASGIVECSKHQLVVKPTGTNFTFTLEGDNFELAEGVTVPVFNQTDRQAVFQMTGVGEKLLITSVAIQRSI